MSWQKKVTSLVQEIESQISTAYQEIQILKEEKTKLETSYKNLQVELKAASNSFDLFTKETLKIASELDKKKTEIEKQENNLKEKEAISNANIETSKSILSQLEREISVKKAELKSIEITQSQIKEAENELERLTTLIQLRSGEVFLLENNILKLDKEIKEKEILFSKANAEQIKDIEKKLAEILSRENKVSDKEKALQEKEQDLLTIENRYRKLYEEKGGSFKI